eukprot:g75009.t1
MTEYFTPVRTRLILKKRFLEDGLQQGHWWRKVLQILNAINGVFATCTCGVILSLSSRRNFVSKTKHSSGRSPSMFCRKVCIRHICESNQTESKVEEKSMSSSAQPTAEKTESKKEQQSLPRITIFSLKTCPHCKKAKALLSQKGWSYYNISLNDYPEKRSDMLKLADRLTVPQVFFNDKHLGGASDLEALQESGRLHQEYKDMISTGKGPSLPELNIPDHPPEPEAKVSPVAEPIVACIGDKSYNYQQVVEKLVKGLDIKTRTYHLKSYPNVFTGTELVDFLLKEGMRNRAKAVQVGEQLRSGGVFDHVLSEHKFKDEQVFYRLFKDTQPCIMNVQRKWPHGAKDKPLVALKAAKNQLSDIVSKYRDDQGLVDYKAVAADSAFPAFETAVQQIQVFSLTSMGLSERVAFCINLYNMMVLHAFAVYGAPRSNLARKSFFDNYGYKVGGYTFSFSELENGVLRGNSYAPYSLLRPFSQNDPRLACAVEKADCRIHFALNCGAKSCPPVKWFTAEALDEELRIVAMSFFEQDSNLKLEGNTLWLSKILSWYQRDFGDNSIEVVKTILPWLRGQRKEAVQKALEVGKKMHVRYFSYDWSNDAKLHSIT